MGIDIELIREVPDLISLSARFFSKSEITELNKTDSGKLTDSFFYCWTRKEAFIKAVGTGLQYPLNSFSVSITGDADPVITEISNDFTEAQEIGNDRRDLGLLKHDFGQPDPVGIFGALPGKVVTAVDPLPVDDPTCEFAHGRRA